MSPWEFRRPCPFCGGTATDSWLEGFVWTIGCDTCDYRGPKANSYPNAIAVWNRRVGDKDLKAAEVNGDQRDVGTGAQAQPAGAAAAPSGIPAGGQHGSGGPPAGLDPGVEWLCHVGEIPGLGVWQPPGKVKSSGLLWVRADATPEQLRAFPDVAAMVTEFSTRRHRVVGRCEIAVQPEERTFPVLGPHWPDSPRSVPWDMVAAHEPQARRNHHNQTLEVLARRGLDPTELVAVLMDRPWRDMRQQDAVDLLNGLLKARQTPATTDEPKPEVTP